MAVAGQIKAGPHFVAAELGQIGALNPGHGSEPNDGESRLYLNALLGLNGTEISISELSAGASIPNCSKERSVEEIYIFLKGQGEFQVDKNIFPVTEGSLVRVLPQGARSWRNTSGEPLLCIIIKPRMQGSELDTNRDHGAAPEQSGWQKKSA